ncbi:hypothetical protein NM208_g1249 [Fusarium decemcellulare]|uniref:Uncharacterized protein n=1 Tax=Fusarium decemcellulare TaxID=57161 RepID=A0ACC1SWT2_9HYPO|nr:hypothetical protein NM208_g1249 [Fusarium decemcellulare]
MHFITTIASLGALVVGVTAALAHSTPDPIKVLLEALIYPNNNCDTPEEGDYAFLLVLDDESRCQKFPADKTVNSVKVDSNPGNCELYIYHDSECTVDLDPLTDDKCRGPEGDNGYGSYKLFCPWLDDSYNDQP